MVKQFEIYLVSLDPTQGKEIKKTRPCVVVSPNVVNENLSTVIVAPMTRTIRNYPTRVKVNFQSKNGEIALDQIRSIDKVRLVKKLGVLKPNNVKQVSEILVEMFAV